MTRTIHVLNGPNLNLLGLREPEHYGIETLDDVAAACRAAAADLGLAVEMLQSNWEGQIVDWIQAARDAADGIVINPGALTHTSVAVLDALNAFDGPVIEVHLSQVHRRETFRHWSYVSQRADAVLVGCGTHGYLLALRQMAHLLKS